MFHRERYKQLKFLIIDEISMVITLLALSGALYRTMHHYTFSIFTQPNATVLQQSL